MEIQGQHAVVTGATRGIGRAVATELARRGARLTIVARSAAPVAAVAEELGGHGFTADLADVAQIDEVVAKATKRQGPIGILINNAGLNAPTGLSQTNGEGLRAQLTTNLIAPLELMRAVLPAMLERNAGCVANIGSIAGDLAIPHQAAYCASKAGLASATRVVQRELRRTKVEALLVVLGLVATDMIGELAKDPVGAAMAKRFALLPELQVDAVARQIVDAVESGRRSLVLPKLAAPMHHVRLIPARVIDGLLAGVRVSQPPTESINRKGAVAL
jgi:3-oxoacyl-[acyl-carrier protein] reductase